MHGIYVKTYLSVLISDVYIQSSEIVRYRVNMYTAVFFLLIFFVIFVGLVNHTLLLFTSNRHLPWPALMMVQTSLAQPSMENLAPLHLRRVSSLVENSHFLGRIRAHF